MVVGLIVALSAACGDRSDVEKDVAPPPPPPAKKAEGCTREAIDDPQTKAFFPSRLEGFCLDADGGKAIGEGTKQKLENLSDFFDGEAEVYHQHKVTRVTQLKYVTEASPAAIDILVSKFDSAESAFAMFTMRVVSDGDPADDATAKPTPGGGAAALGVGNVYLWKGEWLLEIVYSNDTATPAAITKEANAVLPAFAKAIGEKVTGEPGWPALMKGLPTDKRLASGFRLFMFDAFKFAKGPGKVAVGYYADGKKRWRVARFEGTPAEVTAYGERLKKASPGGLFKEDDVEAELVLEPRETTLFVVQDEPRAFKAGIKPEERAALSLSKAEKESLLKTLTR